MTSKISESQLHYLEEDVSLNTSFTFICIVTKVINNKMLCICKMSYESLYDDTELEYTGTPSGNTHIPQGMLSQSGGGIDNMMHGNPQGLYSPSGTRSDVYGMSTPLPKGVYGNLYEKGSSSTDMGTWSETPLKIPPYVPSTKAPVGRQNGVEVKYEDFEMVQETPLQKESSSYILIVLVALALLAANYWIVGGSEYLMRFFNRGEKFSPKDMIIWAVLLTLLIMLISKVSGIPHNFSEHL